MPEAQHDDPPEERRKFTLLRRSLWVAGTLAAAKVAVSVWTGSMGVLASALDSVTDLLISAGNLFALRYAEQPPDEDHRYGHGKAESLASLIQATLILAGAVLLLVESVRRFVGGASVELPWAGVAVMGVAIVVSVLHGRSLRALARRSASPILETESLHYLVDASANLGVIVALVLVWATGASAWDLIVSGLVSLHVGWEAIKLLRKAVLELMDAEPDEQLRERVEAILEAADERIIGHHRLRLRKAGPRLFVDLHIEIEGVEQFTEAHELSEQLRDAIVDEFADVDVTVHYDPAGAR